MAESVKRPYSSTRRQQQAEETRVRILDAADEIFRERGYERASIAAIAKAAGVADETVYGHFKNKRTLLGELVRRAVRGGDGQPVLAQRGPRELVAETDQRRQLERFVADITPRLERVAPLVALVTTAARGEPELDELLHRLHEDRLKNQRVLVDALRKNGPLCLSPVAAAETVWALTSPELYELMTDVRGWSRRRYSTWLVDSLATLLLGPAPTAGR